MEKTNINEVGMYLEKYLNTFESVIWLISLYLLKECQKRTECEVVDLSDRIHFLDCKSESIFLEVACAFFGKVESSLFDCG